MQDFGIVHTNPQNLQFRNKKKIPEITQLQKNETKLNNVIKLQTEIVFFNFFIPVICFQHLEENQ